MGACFLSRGSIRHQKAAVCPAGADNVAYQQHLEDWADQANEDYDAAMLIFTDKKLNAAEPRQCKKGQGNTFTKMGKLKHMQGLLEETKLDWSYALDL
jgi:hypothetical protein